MLTSEALGSERALLHIGKSSASHQKRKPFTSALPPSSQGPVLFRKTKLLFPAARCHPSAVQCCGRGRALPSLQSQHKALRGFQPAWRWGGESCCCHGNRACMKQCWPSGCWRAQNLKLNPTAASQGLALPAPTPLRALGFLLI